MIVTLLAPALRQAIPEIQAPRERPATAGPAMVIAFLLGSGLARNENVKELQYYIRWRLMIMILTLVKWIVDDCGKHKIMVTNW